MEKIQKLTTGQTERFQEFIDKWTDIGLCTDPANREQSEIAINLCYEAAGLNFCTPEGYRRAQD